MYRVLIVDDEPEIRQGLRLKVNWDGIGLHVAGEAGHGGEAAEWLEREPIDIVITDMNMPVMDGLSFLDYCREQHPELRLIVITGYEDFQYAHAAIRNRVRDYLLKPVTRDELTSALQRIKQELDGERSSRDEASALQWQLSRYYKEMKEHFIVQLVRGELAHAHAQSIQEHAGRFRLEAWGETDVRFLTVGLVTGAASGEDARARAPEQFRLAFELLCREYADREREVQQAGDVSAELEVFRDASYPGLMHFVCRGPAEAAGRLAVSLQAEIRGHARLETSVGIGEPVSGFSEWKEGYLSALIAWNMAESDLASEEQTAAGQAAVLIPEETVKVMRRYLSRGELPAFQGAMREALEEAYAASRAGFVKMIFQLSLLLESAAAEVQLGLNSREQLWLRPELALGMDTVDKAEGYLLEIAAKLADRTAQGGGDADQSVIEAAKQYIEENYRYDLNLTMIAERFNYNPSYFSEFFKAKVGRTFIQYLTDVRMAEAVRLLKETTLSLWDIAEFTGFSNASYFSAKFKRVYGMSPSEYRSGQGK